MTANLCQGRRSCVWAGLQGLTWPHCLPALPRSLGNVKKMVPEGDGDFMEYLPYPDLLERVGHTGKRISLLKIDIEGYEFDVLSGRQACMCRGAVCAMALVMLLGFKAEVGTVADVKC